MVGTESTDFSGERHETTLERVASRQELRAKRRLERWNYELEATFASINRLYHIDNGTRLFAGRDTVPPSMYEMLLGCGQRELFLVEALLRTTGHHGEFNIADWERLEQSKHSIAAKWRQYFSDVENSYDIQVH